MGYQDRDKHIIDYGLYELPGVRPHPGGGRFRGPALRGGPYIACVGAAQTFGPYAREPFPQLLSKRTGYDVLNLGSGGASPTFHASNAAIMAYVNRADCTIVQVMSGRSASNSLFHITEHGMHGWSDLHDTEVSALEFWEELVARYPSRLAATIAETRDCYMRSMRTLLDAIATPKVLFWFSTRTPEYTERYELPIQEIWGAFPQFVNRAMVETLAAACDAYVEVVSARGLPQPLYSRDGTPTSVVHNYARLSDRTLVETHNTYYPSPEMHIEAADSLASVVQRLLHSPSRSSSGC